MLAPKGGMIANALQKGANYTNPLSAVGPVVKGAATAAAFPVKHVLGMASGVGGENISQALKSGIENKKAFYKNMAGETAMTDVLDLAKQNLQNMAAEKSAQYRSGMVDIKGDRSVLKFDGIDKSLRDAANAVTFKGQIKNAKGANVVQAISDEIAQWKGLDPAEFHTPEGLDALKQKIGGIVEGIPFEEKTARMVGNKVYSAIKGEITQQAPTYAKVMQEYSEASDTIKEIERALSLGQKASADTAMRKLQSLTRNNVNTNYGNRLDLAKTLEAGGGNEILPSISGQAMSSWTPRGLAGLGGPATLGIAAAMSNPYALAALPFQSPRTIGTLLYGTGQGLRPVKGLLDANPLTPMQMRTGGLLLNQAGRTSPEQD
jgi:hypothetical protein